MESSGSHCCANHSRAEKTPTDVRSLRPRALTHGQPQSRANAPGKSKHNRATSELLSSSTCINDSVLGGAQPPIRSVESGGADSTTCDFHEASTLPHGSSSRPRITTVKPSSNCSSNGVTAGSSTSEAQGNGLTIAPQIPERSRPPSDIFASVARSSLDAEDANRIHVEGVDIVHKPSDKTSQSRGNEIKELGVSFDDLVDRLLSQPMSKYDAKFAAIFLCLYRKFAAPSDLMSAIVHRFERLDQSDDPQILRISSQLRYLNILAQWISDYPGDFAHALTRRNMTSFIAGLAGNRVFAVTSKEMSFHLDIVSEDDDTDWACSDNNRSRASTVESSVSRSSIRSANSTLNAEPSTEDIIIESSPEQGMKRRSTRSSATPSTSSSADRSASQSTGSFQTLLNSMESAQRQAQLLTPIPRNTLTKVQWHQLMELSDDDIARELTRIDWILFSSIRPRDLIRHVILPADQKEKCKSLESVNRMINQFNHVAFWVANMVLLRDKAKHRAKALEKFMGVAWVGQMQRSWFCGLS